MIHPRTMINEKALNNVKVTMRPVEAMASPFDSVTKQKSLQTVRRECGKNHHLRRIRKMTSATRNCDIVWNHVLHTEPKNAPSLGKLLSRSRLHMTHGIAPELDAMGLTGMGLLACDSHRTKTQTP